MNALVKWDPLKDLDEFHNRLASFFDGGVAKRGRESEWLGATWAPLVDITEDDKEYVIQAELPEVEKDKVKVAVNNGVLTLTGERHLEKEEKSLKYHRVERSYGSFARSFTLPEGVEPGKVTAEYKNGVLSVRVPKGEKARPQEIAVKIS